MNPTTFVMGYFKTPAQMKAEIERRNNLSNEEELHEEICKNARFLIDEIDGKIPARIKQFMRINVDRFDLGSDIWEKIFQLHDTIWRLRLQYSVSDRDLVYHLGLANLAKNFNVILKEINTDNENRPALLQRLFVLQFGEEYPDPFRELNMLSSYPDNVEGFERWQPKKTPTENAKEAVSKLLTSISASNVKEQSRFLEVRNVFMDGCIRILCDLIVHFNRAYPEIEWSIPNPNQWSDGRDRTIGSIYDDYLSQL